MSKQYDIAILGAGPGGYPAAIRAAQYGANVAIIEARDLGGVCLNRGCIPSKALLESVHAYKMMKKADSYGLSCGEVSCDIKAVYDRKAKVVEKLRGGVGMLLKKNKVDVIRGRGRLKDKNTIAVEGDDAGEVKADTIILATGTEPMEPSFLPMDGENVATSDQFLSLTELPKSVLVIGGGYIGCEMATVLSGLGAEVTVVEMLPRLLALSDADISKEILKTFKKAKIKVHTDTKVESLNVKKKGEVEATLSGDKTLTVEKVLVCIGRTLNTADIGLDAAGINTSDKGVVEVNDHCQTSVPNIYAIGDITGRAALAHVATKMGLVAAAHAMGKEAHVNYDVIPSCVFTQPEIGQVGLTEEQAKEQGRDVKSARFSYQALGKALAMGETQGFFKIVADAKTGEVLGVHVIGEHASDIIGEAALAMQIECTVEEFAHTIHAHPTLHEGLMECAESWLGLGIHG